MNSVLIIGNPRSGTSLLRSILNTHSQIYIAPECGFAHYLYSTFCDWTEESDIDNFLDALFKCNKIENWNLDRDNLFKYLSLFSISTFQQLVYKVYQFKSKEDVTYLGDKNNYYIKHLAEVDTVFNQPKYIFIIRDGRDVACSYKELMKKSHNSKYSPSLSSDIKSIALEWSINNENALDYFEKYCRNRFLILKYEDLVSAKITVLKEVKIFLGLTESFGNLPHVNDEPEDFSTWKGNLNKKVFNSSVKRFKVDLSKEEQGIFLKNAGKTLARFSYGI